MRYGKITKGKFIRRPNRFKAYVELNGEEELVHVKNTGRCAELLKAGATVYVQKSDKEERKTKWDLIAVEKGQRMINMDSQIPNRVVKEWLEKENLFENITCIRPEYTYGNSRFDLYVEAGERKIFIEVKGVTLEEDGVVRFPDAPSERAVKHVEELQKAVKDGYEAYVFFVIQMKDVRYFTPNRQTHPEFAEALAEAERNGVKILAYDCSVTEDSIELGKEVPVVLEYPQLYEMREPLVQWYRENKRDLPWRENPTPYRVWVSEIMLQQTRVEAVKKYYDRWMESLPDVKALAEVPDDELMKLWEGLGYYNRARNLKAAAVQIMEEFDGEIPSDYSKLLSLRGIGEYTAGAIASIAFGIPESAVDGNALRIFSRILAEDGEINKTSVKKKITQEVRRVLPEERPGDFNQALMDLGSSICIPNGEPFCENCPWESICKAHKYGQETDFPVKAKKKQRKIEKKAVFLIEVSDKIILHKRPEKGLLSGLWELPNLDGELSAKELSEQMKKWEIGDYMIEPLGEGKHIFSHVEWQMRGYRIQMRDISEKLLEKEEWIAVSREDLEEKYAIPSAFDCYRKQIYRG